MAGYAEETSTVLNLYRSGRWNYTDCLLGNSFIIKLFFIHFLFYNDIANDGKYQ
jgi:hypothetical protein